MSAPWLRMPTRFADFLHLLEQMRAKQHRDAALLEIQNEVANLAGARRIDAGRGFHRARDQARLLDHGLARPMSWSMPFRVAAEAAIGGASKPTSLSNPSSVRGSSRRSTRKACRRSAASPPRVSYL